MTVTLCFLLVAIVTITLALVLVDAITGEEDDS